MDLFNQVVTGEIEQGGMDYSTPFVKGKYTLEIGEFGEWKAETVKNYAVKEFNPKTRKSEVVDTIPELTKYSTFAKMIVKEAPEGHEYLVGRDFSHWIHVQPNTMFNIKALLAASLGEGIELAPAMFADVLQGAELEADLNPTENKGRDKEVTDPNTGAPEIVPGRIFQSAEITKFYTK